MLLSGLAEQLGGEIIGDNVEISAMSTDTRALKKGDTYLALVGPNFNGNDFLVEAESSGAIAAIVSNPISKHALPIPLLRVKDTHLALGKIASINRERSTAKVIALTGSQGKTTVKEMIGAILCREGETLITQANQNNTVGVPLTLLQITDQHKFAVIEIGADCHGEIEFSAAMAKPDIALITNANAAHIEGFGSLQGIVEAKGEIIGTAEESASIILNADDENVAQWIELAAGKKVIQFSAANPQADCYAKDTVVGKKGVVSFTLSTPRGLERISLQLLGKHNVTNAVAAATAALEVGASLKSIGEGLGSLVPVNRRLNPQVGFNSCCVVDDTYNASPSSFKAAIDVLILFPERKILIAGDMKELGREAEESHLEVGRYANDSGVDELWTMGNLSSLTSAEFGKNGKHFATVNELIHACKALAASDVVFLVKGSRGAHMEVIVDELIEAGSD
ncbi:MAG: UDP-N-acetylmuramoyl-tripeptide--D-alanyl-D-alanine ligase [Gammaproteobacteria bacterium]|jgi:UDP-N-acetylmuramoyl-tripeptide--D-alanyl-D-alanine ligase|nr:UDP-N-acetylmuramoyl-tripeptide--D-alanyl-D-alanine ligase [Gammaproteobacteria bacterium]